MAEIWPSYLAVEGPEGKYYPGIRELTVAQLSHSLEGLLDQQPGAQLTRDDLVGWYVLQFGTSERPVEEVIDGVQGNECWGHEEDVLRLKFNLPMALNPEQTRNAQLNRIRIGTTDVADKLELPEELSGLLKKVSETNHKKRLVASLYPEEGVELFYIKSRAIETGAGGSEPALSIRGHLVDVVRGQEPPITMRIVTDRRHSSMVELIRVTSPKKIGVGSG